MPSPLHRTAAMIAAWSAAAVLGAPRPIHADPAAHGLRWTRAPGAEACVDEGTLRAAVEARLGARLGGGGDAGAVRTIDARVEATPDGYRARIIVIDEQGTSLGERELVEPGADCRALDDKLSLVIALIVDPDAATRRRAAPPEPEAPTPERPANRSRPWAYTLGVSGSAAIGVLPGLALGGRLALTIDPPSMPPIALAASGWVPDRKTVMTGGARFTLFGAGLALCPSWRRRTIGFVVCGGAEVGRITGTGFDFAANQRATDWIGHVTAAAGVSIPIGGRFSASAALAGWLPLVRPRFVYSDGVSNRTVYQAPAAAGAVQLGISVRL